MARLPRPGEGDNDGTNWGKMLNEFLLVSHNADGSIKSAAITGATRNNTAAAPADATGYLLATNNLNDVADVPTSRDNLGLTTGAVKGALVLNVKDYGAKGDNVALDGDAINAALADAVEGSVVFFPAGIYRVSAPVQMKRNVTLMGATPPPRWSYKSQMPSRIKIDTGSWNGGPALIQFQDMEQAGGSAEMDGAKLVNMGLDCVAVSSGNPHGIYASGHVQDIGLLNVGIWNTKGNGIMTDTYTRVDGSVQICSGWRLDHVSVCQAVDAFHFNRLTDSSFYDCLSTTIKGDGFYFSDPSDNHLTGCRAVFSSGGYGFHLTGDNGSMQLANCSTDRNSKDGFYLNCNDTRQVITLAGCYARRDGYNNNSTKAGYAGLRIVGTSATTPHCPVVVSSFGAHVAGDDNGGGLASPDYGIRIDTAVRQVSLVACSVGGTVAGIQDNTKSATQVGCRGNVTNASYATTYDTTDRVVLQGDATLYRSSADVLKTDDALVVSDALTPKVVSGKPVDTNFLHTPPNGTIAIDNTNSKIYVRINGVWKGAALA